MINRTSLRLADTRLASRQTVSIGVRWFFSSKSPQHFRMGAFLNTKVRSTFVHGTRLGLWSEDTSTKTARVGQGKSSPQNLSHTPHIFFSQRDSPGIKTQILRKLVATGNNNEDVELLQEHRMHTAGVERRMQGALQTVRVRGQVNLILRAPRAAVGGRAVPTQTSLRRI